MDVFESKGRLAWMLEVFSLSPSRERLREPSAELLVAPKRAKTKKNPQAPKERDTRIWRKFMLRRVIVGPPTPPPSPFPSPSPQSLPTSPLTSDLGVVLQDPEVIIHFVYSYIQRWSGGWWERDFWRQERGRAAWIPLTYTGNPLTNWRETSPPNRACAVYSRKRIFA